MIIIIDSRERKFHHISRYFESINQPYIKQKLDFGDYSIQGHETKFAIERKSGKLNLGGGFSEMKRNNLCNNLDRIRFYNEFERAKCDFILLIENANNINDALNIPCEIRDKNYIPNIVFLNIFNEFMKEQNDKRIKAGLPAIEIHYSNAIDIGKKIIELCEKYLK